MNENVETWIETALAVHADATDDSEPSTSETNRLATDAQAAHDAIAIVGVDRLIRALAEASRSAFDVFSDASKNDADGVNPAELALLRDVADALDKARAAGTKSFPRPALATFHRVGLWSFRLTLNDAAFKTDKARLAVLYKLAGELVGATFDGDHPDVAGESFEVHAHVDRGGIEFSIGCPYELRPLFTTIVKTLGNVPLIGRKVPTVDVETNEELRAMLADPCAAGWRACSEEA